MALRFRKRAGHDHGGRRLAYLAVACAVALLLPAVGVARTSEPASSGPALLLTAPPLQVNSAGNGTPWSFGLRPFAAHRSTAVITVNTPNDLAPFSGECTDGPCSLRQAIDKASLNGGDEIELLADRYLVTLGTLVIDRSLNIVGNGGSGAAAGIARSGDGDGDTPPVGRGK